MTRFTHVTPPGDEWPREFREAAGMLARGDLDGALQGFEGFVGPGERDVPDEERPIVAAAVLNTGAILDKQGHVRAAIQVYDLASSRFERETDTVDHPWLTQAFAGARLRRDWLEAQLSSQP